MNDTQFRRIEGLIPIAAADVINERRRQIQAEGFDISHDDEHTDRSLARVAACYAFNASGENYSMSHIPPFIWPGYWASTWWKPKDRRRDLVRAAALIIAEIERLDRAADKP